MPVNLRQRERPGKLEIVPGGGRIFASVRKLFKVPFRQRAKV
jgi:hypothetical protein